MSCEEFGCYFEASHGNSVETCFCCHKCGESMVMSNNAIEDAHLALTECGIYLWE
jgi:hypothetical protein